MNLLLIMLAALIGVVALILLSGLLHAFFRASGSKRPADATAGVILVLILVGAAILAMYAMGR